MFSEDLKKENNMRSFPMAAVTNDHKLGGLTL